MPVKITRRRNKGRGLTEQGLSDYLQNNIGQRVQNAVTAVANFVFQIAMQRVPEDTKSLAATGAVRVYPPSGDLICQATVGFGQESKVFENVWSRYHNELVTKHPYEYARIVHNEGRIHVDMSRYAGSGTGRGFDFLASIFRQFRPEIRARFIYALDMGYVQPEINTVQPDSHREDVEDLDTQSRAKGGRRASTVDKKH